MSRVAAHARNLTGRRVYHAIDWGGWLLLLLLAAIFVGTGVSVRFALTPAHPLLGALAVIVGGMFASIWGALYYSFRVSAHAIVSAEALTLVHGPFRHTLHWRDVARVSEWTTLTDGIRYRWIALWSHNGMRLQVREDLVPNFPAFRADVLQSLGLPQGMPDLVTNLEHPLIIISDRSPAIVGWGMSMTIGIIGGVAMLAYLPEILLFDIVVLGGGIVSLIIASALLLWRQEIIIGSEGVRAKWGFSSITIPWAAMYGMARDPGNSLRGAAGILARGLIMVLFRIDRRTVIVPGEERTHGVIRIRGNSGERIIIREEHFRHPEWLRARLRSEVERLKQRQDPAGARVMPLPPTGKLRGEVELPPEVLETSTLWLRDDINPINIDVS